jgi:hypothetical protein
MVHGPDPSGAAPGPPPGAPGHAHPHEHPHGHPGPHAEHPDEAHDHHGFAEAARAIGLSTRTRKLRTGVLVATFTVALLTLAAEVLLRVTDHRERALATHVTRTNRRWVELTRAGLFEELADPVRRYAMRPGADAVVDGWRFRVSNARTRGPDVPAEKPPGERRILCLGDSFAFGLWCDEEETLVARLAAAANAAESERASGVAWRWLDLGVPGYHLGQTVRAFEQDGLALAPDLVVLYFNTNDIEQTGFHYDAELGVLRRDYLPLPEGLKRALWDWSHVYGWIAGRHARAVEAGPAPYLEPRVPWAHVRADNQAYTRAALARLAELCRARDLPLFVVNQPLITWLGGTRRDDWPVLELDAWFRGVCAELELPALHLLGWLRGYSDNVDRFAEGVEPDLLTDKYIADERMLEALEWVRARAREAGADWDALSFAEQLPYFAGLPGELPEDPDFHLTGAGYADVARLAYARLRAEGLLP